LALPVLIQIDDAKTKAQVGDEQRQGRPHTKTCAFFVKVTVATTFDGMNRPVSKSYSGGGITTPPVMYCYDGHAFDPVAQACGTITATGSVLGRLTGIGNSTSTTNFTNFSNRGFILASKQTTAATDYTFGYSYWAGGALRTLTYPSQRQVTYSLDTAGRINQVQNLTGGGAPSYASGIQYAPHGAVQQMTLGNQLVEQTQFNVRLQPCAIRVGATATIAPGAPCPTRKGGGKRGRGKGGKRGQPGEKGSGKGVSLN
jgi:hypothetical protein